MESWTKWLNKQYHVIEGHLKWAIILTITTALTWTAHYVDAHRADIASWLNLALPIFAIVAVLYLVLSRSPRRESAPSAKPLTLPPPPAPTLPALPSPPAPVNLQGEIQELYFKSEGIPGLLQKMFVVMKVRVVNFGPDEAAITDIKLNVNVGESHLAADFVKTIPNDWRIKKRITDLFSIAYDETPLEPPLLSAESEPQIYRKGVPKTGWIAFEWSGFSDIEFPNGEFVLFLKDSFGKWHVVTRKPMVYEKPGEIVDKYRRSSLPSP
jgi:hypothetical protein